MICLSLNKKISGETIFDDFLKLQAKYTEKNMRIPDKELIKSSVYKASELWAQKLINEKYTVIDIGYPVDVTSESVFYNMELELLFHTP